MSIFGDLIGFSAAGRAAGAVGDANIAAEHGVLNATKTGQDAVTGALTTNSGAVNEAGSRAIDTVSQYGNYANNTLGGNLDTATGSLSPFIDAGQQGVRQLSNYASSNPQFSFNPTQQQLEQTPGYQFQLSQGLNAVQNSAAAAGMGNSSNAMEGMANYATGLAGTYYQNAFNNAQNTFQTNQNTTLANLSTLAGAGLSGTAQQNQALIGMGNPMAANTYNTGLFGGNTINNGALFNAQQNLSGTEYGAGLGLQGGEAAGNFAVGAGTARAAGINNQAGALSSLVGDIGSRATTFL